VNAARRLTGVIACAAALAGCAAMHGEVRPASAPVPWDQRVLELRRESSWQLDGRAAVALGQQGWQASLDWRQSGKDSELHLAGPFGVGSLAIKSTAEGLSLNGAPPSDAVAAQLQEKLGFELPLDDLRYWLLGIPDPDGPFELTRNPQDRAQHLSQAGWSIEYAEYMPSGADSLPKRMVLSRADARVRIAVDRWQISP
jgi:outer membrane lipoprotein LolB